MGNIKACKSCTLIKPINEFVHRNDRKNSRRNVCKTCTAKKMCVIRENLEGTEKYTKQVKIWKLNRKLSGKIKEYDDSHKEQSKNTSLIRKFGITLETHNDILKKQENSCAICKNKTPKGSFNVDHDHKSGKVRGLLCGNCNKGLGLFKDNTENLLESAEYLKHYQPNFASLVAKLIPL